MLPSAARPRSTKVEVCTPIEGMSSRTGADPRMIGPRSTGATGALDVGGPGVVGAAAPAPAADRVGRGAGVAATGAAGAAAAAAAGWGGPSRLRPRVITAPA